MTCNHSSAAVIASNDGDSSFASSVAQEMGDMNMAHFNINGIFPFENLPVELQNKIIEYAMIAKDHEIRFPCLTNANYQPNVTVGLLLVSHRIYHEAHYQLRKQNTFIFGNFGSDLKTIASSIGPLKCRSGACGHDPLRSSLTKATFELGDDLLPDHADDLVHAFRCALRYLRSEVIINSLHLSLAFYTFGNRYQLSDFASSLNKIKVLDRLTITGDKKYLRMNFEDIPSSLDMNAKPVISYSQPYKREVQDSPGWFLYQYVSKNYVGHPQQNYSAMYSAILLELRKIPGGPLSG